MINIMERCCRLKFEPFHLSKFSIELQKRLTYNNMHKYTNYSPFSEKD